MSIQLGSSVVLAEESGTLLHCCNYPMLLMTTSAAQSMALWFARMPACSDTPVLKTCRG
jgi:hypothetical protein